MDALSDEEGELVGVLTDRGHAHRPRPVVVEVAQPVGQHLEVVRLQPGVVLDHVVRGRVDGALPHGLGDEEEVVALREGDHVVDDGAGGRVRRWPGRGLRALEEEAGVDPLGDDDVGQRRLDLGVGEDRLDRRDLSLGNRWRNSVRFLSEYPEQASSVSDEVLRR